MENCTKIFRIMKFWLGNSLGYFLSHGSKPFSTLKPPTVLQKKHCNEDNELNDRPS